MYTFEDRGGRLTNTAVGRHGSCRPRIRPKRPAQPAAACEALLHHLQFFVTTARRPAAIGNTTRLAPKRSGIPSPAVDAEVIDLLWSTYRALGIDDLRLELNSLGDPDTRPAYRQALVDYFTPLADSLDFESRERLSSNPLRILDSKNPAVADLGESAPRSLDFIGRTRTHPL